MLRAATISLVSLFATQAVAQRLPLAPPDTTIAYTAYALGIVPVHAFFQRFAGTVRLDPASPAACDIDVTIQVASLQMDNPDRRRLVLGATMLDAAHFPTMSFKGACAPAGVEGRLNLHGVSHDLTMTLRKVGNELICSGTLQRGDYGVDGLRGLVGSRIRLQLATPAPAAYLWHPAVTKTGWGMALPQHQGSGSRDDQDAP